MMKNLVFKQIFFAASLLILGITACETGKKNPNFQQDAANPEFLHRSLLSLTATIKHDIFPPMIASRIYAYAQIAGYEALIAGTPQYRSLAGQIKELPNLPRPESGKEYCYALASVKAYLKVGKALVFSEDSISAVTTQFLNEFKALGVPRDVFDRSVALGDTIGGAIIKWSKSDSYAPTRSMPKYTVTVKNPARWLPTSPDYADALEPHWRKIRNLTMDSAAQFKPIRPTAFDSTKSSKFYKEAYEVFKSVQDSTPERIATAWYWDDNPAATNNTGHVNFLRKKVTPPGHWLHIVLYTARAKKADIFASAEAYVMTAIALFESGISCWDEKYRSEVIRPETYINRYIDPTWRPILVTPPFPEYTSGHSAFSGAALSVLNHYFGKNTNFTDSTEVQFGIPPRSFLSFEEAAAQASVSRLYGGIHYRPAIDEGLKQGKAVGDFVVGKIKTK